MIKPLYIFDLDGTLALIDHRRHFVESKKPDWQSFFQACDKDQPNDPVIKIMERLHESADIWIFSGRSDEVELKTLEWLAKHTSFVPGERDKLFMREAGDYTPDDILKQSWLDSMRANDLLRLVAVFDDRDKVVNMWRKNGITCLQVAPGDF